jgi:hypothetical protein
MRPATGYICLADGTSGAQPYTAKIRDMERSSLFTCDLFHFLSRPSSSICISHVKPHSAWSVMIGRAVPTLVDIGSFVMRSV